MTAPLAGAALGVAIVIVMYVAGLLRERSGLTVLVAAVAAFYPVFAVGHGGLALHAGLFAAFAGAAILAFRRGAACLAALLGAHGALDLALGATWHPGPGWWPAFCAALDLSAAAMVLALLRSGRIPA